ncbi:hypothetical protein [Thermoleophilum album]|uniref:Uncharacterized protein n=1 Tax=Thermoleophilum album TaxID=29539 RepID=A0A1H6FPJ4_THEAL|nr:hypothetical protein [Thermoleophilum album]SEH12272.1 hypothetical protein SAMN02745716_1037 [Thermoleophilum album]
MSTWIKEHTVRRASEQQVPALVPALEELFGEEARELEQEVEERYSPAWEAADDPRAIGTVVLTVRLRC